MNRRAAAAERCASEAGPESAGVQEHAAGAIIAENSRPSPSGLAPANDAGGAGVAVVDLAPDGPGSGPRWGMQSEELNATLLTWPAGHEIAAHVNDEREVMLVMLAGCARVLVDGVEHHLSGDQLLVIPRGCVRAIVAGPTGVRYLSTHRRRGPLVPTARSDR